MLKKDGKRLLFSVLSILFAVLTFVSLAFKFVMVTTKYGNVSKSTNISLSKWQEFIKTSKTAITQGIFKKGDILFWQMARVFMVLTLIAVGITVMLVVLQLFMENDTIWTMTKIFGIVSIVLSSLFMITFIVGGLMISNKISVEEMNIMYLPTIGSIMLFLFGILSPVFGLLSIKKEHRMVTM